MAGSGRTAVLIRKLRAGRSAVAVAVLAASLVPVAQAPAAAADGQASDAYASPTIAEKPYMGWSSWSLESTNYPGVNPTGPASWLTEQHVLEQADVLAAKLKNHGYEYVNIDAGWLGGFDGYGRPVPKATTFPDGIKYIA